MDYRECQWRKQELLYQKFSVVNCIKAADDTRIVTGIASTFDKDQVSDIILPGAFTKTIKEGFPKNRIKVLWQHYTPIGKLLEIKETPEGLWIKARISKTTTGNDALELLRDEAIDSMSIGFDIVKDMPDEENKIRFIHEVKLWEVSFVTFPANLNTSVLSVKSVDDYTRMVKSLRDERWPTELKAGRTLSHANVGIVKSALTAVVGVEEHFEAVKTALNALLLKAEKKPKTAAEDEMNDAVEGNNPVDDEEDDEEKSTSPSTSKQKPQTGNEVDDPTSQSFTDVLADFRKSLERQPACDEDEDAQVLKALQAFSIK